MQLVKKVIFIFFISLFIMSFACAEGFDPVMRTSKQANVRKQPNTSSDLIERLPKQTEVNVDSVININNEIWAKIQTKSKREGYILFSLLEPLPTPTPVPTPTPTPTPSPTPSPSPIPTPTPTASPTPVPDFSNVTYDENDPSVFRVSKDGSNIRKNADRKSDIIRTLPKHSVVRVINTVVSSNEYWAYIRSKDTKNQGWMLLELLEPIPTPSPTPLPTEIPTPSPDPTPSPSPTPSSPEEIEEPFDEPMIVRTTTKSTNIRELPSQKRLTSVKSLTKLTAVGRVVWDNVTWLHILGGMDYPEGYISEELVERIRPVVLTEVSEYEVRQLFPYVSLDPMSDSAPRSVSYTQEEMNQYKTLQPGDRNSRVINLKQRLYDLGYYRNSENINNTLYTKSTGDIIAEFQQAVGLDTTGIADPLTQCYLFDNSTLSRKESRNAKETDDLYLKNKDQPLWIQKAEITSYDFYGSIQLSVRNKTDAKVTSFSIKVIPNSKSGEPMGWENSFLKEITREYSIKNLSIAPNYVYSDFETNETADWEFTWPHHFVVAYKTYFSGAQIAISKYKSGKQTYIVDDDQLVWVPVGKAVNDILIHTMPVSITSEERNFANWDLGLKTYYVNPLHSNYYNLTQGAYVETVAPHSPAEESGLEPGDIIVGINNVTILGDATLRKARGQILPGDVADLYFWRSGKYYKSGIIRPQENAK